MQDEAGCGCSSAGQCFTAGALVLWVPPGVLQCLCRCGALQSLFPSGHSQFAEAGSYTLRWCCARNLASRGCSPIGAPTSCHHPWALQGIPAARQGKWPWKALQQPKSPSAWQKPHGLDMVKGKTALGYTSPWGLSILHCRPGGKGNAWEFPHLPALHHKGKSQLGWGRGFCQWRVPRGAEGPAPLWHRHRGRNAESSSEGQVQCSPALGSGVKAAAAASWGSGGNPRSVRKSRARSRWVPSTSSENSQWESSPRLLSWLLCVTLVPMLWQHPGVGGLATPSPQHRLAPPAVHPEGCDL